MDLEKQIEKFNEENANSFRKPRLYCIQNHTNEIFAYYSYDDFELDSYDVEEDFPNICFNDDTDLVIDGYSIFYAFFKEYEKALEYQEWVNSIDYNL